MSPALYRLGRFAASRPWTVIATWVLASVLVVSASSAFGRDLEDSFEVPGLDSQLALDLLTVSQSDEAGLTAQVVVAPDTPARSPADAVNSLAEANALTDPELAAALLALTDDIRALPDVLGTQVTTSPDGSVAIVRIQYPTVNQLSSVNLEELLSLTEQANETGSITVESGGELHFAFAEPETGIGEMIGIIAAMVILLVAFGSLIAMGLPIAMALFGLALGISAMSLVTYLIEIPSWAPQMASMIGLGVGIDYALFLVTRHREFLAQDLDIPEAAGRAMATAGSAVLFAGGTVVIAILGLAVAGVPFMTAAGVATSVIVLLMVLSSLTLLPALLGLAGHRVNGRRGRRPSKVGRDQPAVGERWERWGRHVADHAWPYAIGVTAALVALTLPVLGLQIGFPDDGNLPESRTERRAYDLISDGFGPGTNGPLVIAVDISSDATIVEPLLAAIQDDPGVVAIAGSQVNLDAGVATIVAVPHSSPQDPATLETIERLRSDVFPSVLAGTQATAHVGGGTATFADIGAKVSSRLGLFVAAVLLLSFLLLMIVFRSILVPLKAALLNLLSIGAAYGVLVMVFQWGWGMSLIGLEATVPIIPFMPMFMFAILFGLSMDYEVFLLSRVREEYLRTGNNHDAVVHGLASTARVITSAALIMISVFLGFVLGDDPAIKMMGLGLATAIFVDATVVRMILVPATMTLLGDRNWWLPAWLEKRLPVLDVEGGTFATLDEVDAVPDLIGASH